MDVFTEVEGMSGDEGGIEYKGGKTKCDKLSYST